ncbi:SH3 domain-containing protein [Nitratireductor sp. XY-223]|uniref:SH3 domain-containing protein n=1 Tax=Nitratireductor sp. XY-223 TaxID=2561926 RepID=UPI0010AA391D|nr:SH3 domain-containing protein [Nitratireductor sp. XY-223]
MNLKTILPFLAAVVVIASPARAASTASVTVDLNLRAGPSTQYPVVTVVPQSAPVTMYGCNANVTWCDIAYGSQRGWASANYIRVSSGGTQTVVTPAVAATVGIATVAYSRAYWDNYYSTYPWYGQWNVYYRPPPPPPPPPGSVTGGSGCIGNACGATRTTTGSQGNTLRQSGGCVGNGCATRQTVTTPTGNSASKTVTCRRGDPNCTVRRTGPAGNTHIRQRPVRP